MAQRRATGVVFGAQLFVRGASRLGATLSVSSLVTGLTVAAYGTSSPEPAVSIRSALAGAADPALGNAVGSKIFNILLVLGTAAAISPMASGFPRRRFNSTRP